MSEPASAGLNGPVDPAGIRYEGRTCLITGGAGFIGSHLAEELLRRGARVLVLDDLSTGSLRNIAGLRGHDRFEFYQGSVADCAELDELVHRADEVYHLAAAVGVDFVVKYPIETVTRNIFPTERVLDLATADRRRVFVASSSEVYGRGSAAPMREQDDTVLGAPDKTRYIYALTKLVDEYLALAYHRQRGLPVVIGRFFNVVGPRQSGRYGMVIPRFVTQALRGGPIIVHDDGNQIRCFMHVRDAVQVMIGLMNNPAAYGQIVNIGSDVAITIRQLAERVRAAVGNDVAIEHVSYEQAFGPGFEDVRCRIPSLAKLRSLVKLENPRDLDAILHDVIAFEASRSTAEEP